MLESPIVPCLWFDCQAQAAAAFYTEVFPDGRVTAVSHYPESSDNPSQKPRGSVLTVEFEIAGQKFTALNGGPHFVPNPSVSFFVLLETVEAVEQTFRALAEGGQVLMPLDRYPWSERYGWVQDRFGVSWQVMVAGPAAGDATIVPCLMFAGRVHGRAEEAIQAYTRIFPDGKVEAIARYTAGEEGREGKVKHARFLLAGQSLAAMDSHIDNGVVFNEALSLQIMCDDQRELDRYWEALSEGGEQGPCGWLKDRFGLSWQVVPRAITAWMTSQDAASRDRAFAAMMGMKKLDLAALQAAFDGQ